MAGSLKKVLLIGNLGRDPETRNTQSGDPICHLNLAVSESWKDKNSGERKEKTEWVRIVIFNEHHAKFAQQYLKKGAKVYVEGAMQTRKWTDQSGVEKYTTEVVLQKFRGELLSLDSRKSEGNDAGGQSEGNDAGGQSGGYDQIPVGGGDLNDEVPFAPETRL